MLSDAIPDTGDRVTTKLSPTPSRCSRQVGRDSRGPRWGTDVNRAPSVSGEEPGVTFHTTVSITWRWRALNCRKARNLEYLSQFTCTSSLTPHNESIRQVFHLSDEKTVLEILSHVSKGTQLGLRHLKPEPPRLATRSWGSDH